MRVCRIQRHSFGRIAHGVLAIALAMLSPDGVFAAAEQTSGLSEILTLLGMDSDFFAAFADDRPLEQAERESAYRLLNRLHDLPLAAVNEDAEEWAAENDALAKPLAGRGKLFHVRGKVTRVEAVKLSPAERDRLGINAVFRCAFTTTDGTRLEVLTAHVPGAWNSQTAMDEPASFRGILIKRLSADAAEQAGRLLFVTARMEWHPDTLPGQLGMDVGLFDDVEDRKPLTARDRECFYQLLSAVTKSQPGQLENQANAQVTDRRQQLTQRIAELGHDAREQADLKRQLGRAEKNVDDVVPLFNDAAAQRGKLFVLEGDAQRVIEIKVEDADIVRRCGIRRYYEIEIVTDDSQGNPLAFCVAELPRGMPTGEELHERVRIAGVFLKTWAYPLGRSADDPSTSDGARPRQQLAPLLIAQGPVWIEQDTSPYALGGIMLVLVGSAILLAIFWLWWQRRGDKQFGRRAISPLAAKPDFSHLE